MGQNPPPSSGVFLSYAREDTEAARRIADALRAFGVEVWFDQSELRGGDSWDAKIKKQIRECALFVPIISANTQARGEGYFRREWKLAVERTHDMASGMAFLVPIVVDDTLESAALVPEELMKVQWTRLARGVPTSAFVERIRSLVENPRISASQPAVRISIQNTVSAPAKGTPPWVWGVVATVIVLAVCAGYFLRRPAPPVSAASGSASAAPAKAPAATPALDDKSLAVLPFANMSADKDNEFFTDGIHEDILTNLAHIRDLRVVSRTSVMRYKNTEESIRQIAQELGVAYILEGSVRRAGNKVRVTGQLIHAATDEHVWAQAYDRDVTDIFAIQGELAESIAGALKTALSPEEKALISHKPTENPAAYDLFLRARDAHNRDGGGEATTNRWITLLNEAVKADPKFGEAWAELADAYAFSAFNMDGDVNSLVAKAKDAMDRAIALSPDDPDVVGSLGTYYYYAYRDYAKATEQYQKLAAQRPNDAAVYNSMSLILRRQGRWAESMANGRKAVSLDPANIGYIRNFVATLNSGNYFDEMRDYQKRLVAFFPDRINENYLLVSISFYQTGSTEETDAYFAHLTPEQANSPEGISCREDWAVTKGDFAEAVRLDKLQPYFADSNVSEDEQVLLAARCRWWIGDKEGAKARLGDTLEKLRGIAAKEPKNARRWIDLGLAEAIAGNFDEAKRCEDRGVSMMPVSLDALTGPVYEGLRANIYDMAGDKETTFDIYRRLLRIPGGLLAVKQLARTPSCLKGDPRFESLLKDPANNDKLF